MIILLGVVAQGMVWVKSQAEKTMLVNRASQLGTALELYYQDHRGFPSSCSPHLEDALAPYVAGAELLTDAGDPAAGAGPLNKSYVQPVPDYPNSYVLALPSQYDGACSAVLFADTTVEIVQELPVFYNGGVVEPGTTATGGRLSFATGSTIELSEGSTATIVQSFVASDGTPFQVVKMPKGEPGFATAIAAQADIIQLASDAGIMFLRDGGANAEVLPNGDEDHMKVSTHAGEVRVWGEAIERGQAETTHDDDGGDGDDATGQLLDGQINLNPSDNSTFEFILQKPDGTTITRDDLHASNGQLEYTGHATTLTLRFKPTGNCNQNYLTIDRTVYPLDNGRVYTITATNMTLHLYNKNKDGKGSAMGHWWLDQISATEVHITSASAGSDPVPNYPDDPANDTDESGDNTADGVDDDETSNDLIHGRICRTLCRGIPVLKGRWIKVRARR